MENNVEKFDPYKLMDGVKDRIKATFVALIPDDQWDQMCDAEMKKFFEPRMSGGYNSTQLPSQFSELVQTIMKEQCTQHLKDHFNKPEFTISEIWNNSALGKDVNISTYLENIIKEKMPDMMQAMMMNIMANAFQSFFSQVQNNLQYVR